MTNLKFGFAWKDWLETGGLNNLLDMGISLGRIRIGRRVPQREGLFRRIEFGPLLTLRLTVAPLQSPEILAQRIWADLNPLLGHRLSDGVVTVPPPNEFSDPLIVGADQLEQRRRLVGRLLR